MNRNARCHALCCPSLLLGCQGYVDRQEEVGDAGDHARSKLEGVDKGKEAWVKGGGFPDRILLPHRTQPFLFSLSGFDWRKVST